MCGIIAYIGHRDALSILISGLQRLEYRGYDSAGIAVLVENRLHVTKCAGRIDDLKRLLEIEGIGARDSHVGLGHTRWATHGPPVDKNAHPHSIDGIALIHNGIIENYQELKEELRREGVSFISDTDSEVILQLIAYYRKKCISIEQAIEMTVDRLKGSYSLVILDERHPEKIYAVRKESPLVMGIGDGEFFLASDVPAFLEYTSSVIFIEDNELVVLETPMPKIFNLLTKKEVKRSPIKIAWTAEMAQKMGHAHFMHKEIMEQPQAIVDTIRGNIYKGTPRFEHIGIDDNDLKRVENISIVACGTSYHAGLLGRLFFEKWIGVPTQVEFASEYRYRSFLLKDDSLIIAISQSGETADTIAAVRDAKSYGINAISICNVLDSSIVRVTDGVIYTHAGPEISVASTKAFTTQVVALVMLAGYMAHLRDNSNAPELKKMISALLGLPDKIEELTAREDELKELANKLHDFDNALYLGRGQNYPVAMEGALKLKEISYIHAEAYPAGEMKHGPIALIDKNMPVVFLVPQDETYEKSLNNAEEVITREGKLILISDEISDYWAKNSWAIFRVPTYVDYLMPILLTIPLQLLAYHTALFRGTDVDRPRNLAKSVTVE